MHSVFSIIFYASLYIAFQTSFVCTVSLIFLLLILTCMYSILSYFVNALYQNKLTEKKNPGNTREANFFVVLKSSFMDLWYQFRSHTDFWEICKSHDNGHIKLVFQLISGEPGFILFPFQTPLKPSQSVLQAHELDFFCPSQTDKTHPTLAALML